MDNEHDMPAGHPERQRRWFRLQARFGLRALLVLLTLACVGAALVMARYRAAERMVARRDRVLTAILEARSTPPEGLVFARASTLGLWSKPIGDTQKFFHVEEATAGGRIRQAAISGRSTGNTTLNWSYDLSQGAAVALSASDIRDRIVSSITKQLASFNPRPSTSLTNGVATAGARYYRGIHYNDLFVLVDVDVDKERGVAEVDVLVVDSQSAGLW